MTKKEIALEDEYKKPMEMITDYISQWGEIKLWGKADIEKLMIQYALQEKKNTFTVEEIATYIYSKDSMGDIAHYLSADNIIKANEPDDNDEDIRI